jgi:chromosome segregation ATPase
VLLAATSAAKRFEHELQLTKAQLETLSKTALEANAQYEVAKAEARMAQLAVESLQNRMASLEKDYTAVKMKYDDVSPCIDRERQSKVVVEKMLQQTTEINTSLARDLSTLQESSKHLKKKSVHSSDFAKAVCMCTHTRAYAIADLGTLKLKKKGGVFLRQYLCAHTQTYAIADLGTLKCSNVVYSDYEEAGL